MGFSIFDRSEISELVDSFSEADAVVVIVGAGASVEAGLPGWEDLVRRLLRRAMQNDRAEAGVTFAERDLDAWVEETIAAEGSLGSLAVADALSQGRLRSWLPLALFGEQGAETYLPGPISRQIAHLSVAFGDKLDIITTNFDDLLEVALRERTDIGVPVVPYVGDTHPSGPHIKVTHPHGFLGRDQWRGDIILTEEEYHTVRQAHEWQDTYLGYKLREYPCLFVGASLTDPNLLRWLHDYRGAQGHVAVFVRQAERIGLPSAVRTARQHATIERWKNRGVDAVFLDHFADVAHLLHEIAYRRVHMTTYRPLSVRAGDWIARTEEHVIGWRRPGEFRACQEALNAALTIVLQDALRTLRRLGIETGDERLALALWLMDETGDAIYMWATTDRIHVDPTTIRPEVLDAASRWVAVRTMCFGTSIAESRDVYTSRWRYIRGLPLNMSMEADGWLPVGCLTVTSMTSSDETLLANLPGGVEAEFNRALVRGTERYLEQALSTVERGIDDDEV